MDFIKAELLANGFTILHDLGTITIYKCDIIIHILKCVSNAPLQLKANSPEIMSFLEQGAEATNALQIDTT